MAGRAVVDTHTHARAGRQAGRQKAGSRSTDTVG
eukprot:COSAG01_NODE_17600_length_1138_cov_1.337825_1_plen_33_part_10